MQIGTDTDWASVAAAFTHTMAIKTDGSLWAWGSNTGGQLGDGTTTDHSSPVHIGTDTDWAAVAPGSGHTVAVKIDGSLWAWGSNSFGQLGDGTTTSRLTPAQVGNDTDWLTAAAAAHSVGLKTDGTIWTWGYNGNGQIGDGTPFDHSKPLQIGTDATGERLPLVATQWPSGRMARCGDGDRAQPLPSRSALTRLADGRRGRRAFGGAQDRRHVVGVGIERRRPTR